MLGLPLVCNNEVKVDLYTLMQML